MIQDWRFCLSSASYLQQDVLIWISCIPSDPLIFEGEHIHIFKVVSLHSLVYFSLRFSQDFIWIVKRFYTSWHDHQLPLSPVLQLFSSLTCSHVFVWSGACPHAKSASDHHHHPKYVFSPLSPLDIIIVKAAILHFYQFAICKRTYMGGQKSGNRLDVIFILLFCLKRGPGKRLIWKNSSIFVSREGARQARSVRLRPQNCRSLELPVARHRRRASLLQLPKFL